MIFNCQLPFIKVGVLFSVMIPLGEGLVAAGAPGLTRDKYGSVYPLITVAPPLRQYLHRQCWHLHPSPRTVPSMSAAAYHCDVIIRVIYRPVGVADLELSSPRILQRDLGNVPLGHLTDVFFVPLPNGLQPFSCLIRPISQGLRYLPALSCSQSLTHSLILPLNSTVQLRANNSRPSIFPKKSSPEENLLLSEHVAPRCVHEVHHKSMATHPGDIVVDRRWCLLLAWGIDITVVLTPR